MNPLDAARPAAFILPALFEKQLPPPIRLRLLPALAKAINGTTFVSLWRFKSELRLPAQNLTVPDDVLLANNAALRERQVSEWGLLHTERWERDDC